MSKKKDKDKTLNNKEDSIKNIIKKTSNLIKRSRENRQEIQNTLKSLKKKTKY